MTITYPISLPTVQSPTKTHFDMDGSVGVSESPFSYSQQVQKNQGQRWVCQIQFPPMRRVNATQFIAAMSKLNGRQGTFLFGDYDGRTPRGSAAGTPLVNGGAQIGGTLLTKGWTHSASGVLLPGDYIQTGSGATARLYVVQDQVNADSSGDASVNIWPDLRYSPADGATIVLNNTQTQFRLDAKFGWDADEVSTYGIQFSATEAL